MRSSKEKQDAADLFSAGEYQHAAKHCENVLKLSPGDVETRIYLARSLMALRKNEAAQQELRQCIRIMPQLGIAYRLLGELTLRRKEYESAKMFLRQAIRIDTHDKDAQHLLKIATSIEGTPSHELQENKTFMDAPLDVPLSPMPEYMLPPPTIKRGFGNYLNKVGMLNDKQLSDIVSYHKQHAVRIGQAAVSLGYVSPQKIEWAAMAYHTSNEN